MKLHTLEKVRDCLKNEEPKIVVPEEIAEKSINAIERMLEASK
jgi:quinolinate synthase